MRQKKNSQIQWVVLITLAMVFIVACSAGVEGADALPTATPPPTNTPFQPTPTQLPPPTVTPFPTATTAPTQESADVAQEGEATPEETVTGEAAPQPTSESPAGTGDTSSTAISDLRQGELIYRTDFTQGWPSLSDTVSSSSSYAVGRSYVLNLDIGRRWFVTTTQLNKTDFIAQVTTTTAPTCPTGAGYGLFFRYSDETNYFALTFFCSGRVAVFARAANILIQPALLDTTLPSGLSAADGQPHRITVTAKGSNFIILFDGQEVGAFASDLHPQGDIALYAASSSTEGYQVIYAGLEVYEVLP